MMNDCERDRLYFDNISAIFSVCKYYGKQMVCDFECLLTEENIFISDCNGEKYDPDTQMCCNGRLFTLQKNIDCCGNEFYDIRAQTCILDIVLMNDDTGRSQYADNNPGRRIADSLNVLTTWMALVIFGWRNRRQNDDGTKCTLYIFDRRIHKYMTIIHHSNAYRQLELWFQITFV